MFPCLAALAEAAVLPKGTCGREASISEGSILLRDQEEPAHVHRLLHDQGQVRQDRRVHEAQGFMNSTIRDTDEVMLSQMILQGEVEAAPTPWELRWQVLVDRMWTWFDENRAVDHAIGMVAALTQARGDLPFSTWAEGPIESLAAGVVHFHILPVHDRTPADFFEWAQEIVEYLWEAYERDREDLERQVEGSSSEGSAEAPAQPAQDPGPSDGEQPVAGDEMRASEEAWAQAMNAIYLRFRTRGVGRMAFTRLRARLRPQRTSVQRAARRTIPLILDRGQEVAQPEPQGEPVSESEVDEWVTGVLQGWKGAATFGACSIGVGLRSGWQWECPALWSLPCGAGLA